MYAHPRVLVLCCSLIIPSAVQSQQGSTTTPAIIDTVGNSIPAGILPPIAQFRTPGTKTIPHTAAEWDAGVGLMRVQSRFEQPPNVKPYPADSIREAVSARAKVWITTLNASGLAGLQLDSYGKILVVANQEDKARDAFSKRLASPGMTTTDSAFTLNAAVTAFADADYPQRLPISESYMAQLDKLGTDASYWKYQGHVTLFRAYALVDNSEASTGHIAEAIQLLPKLFFKTRRTFYMGGLDMYLSLYDVSRTTPAGKARLEQLNKYITDATIPPASLVALDSSVVNDAGMYRNLFQMMLSLASKLGTPAPELPGTSWINTPDTASHVQPLNDGVVRIIGIGGQTEAINFIPAFDRILTQLNTSGKAQGIFHFITSGHWGVKFVTPAEETRNLREYFTVKNPIRLPVAIWAGEKTLTADGGMKPTQSPFVLSFKTYGFPMAIIVDKQGNIRRIFPRGFTRDNEERALSIMNALLQEGIAK